MIITKNVLLTQTLLVLLMIFTFLTAGAQMTRAEDTEYKSAHYYTAMHHIGQDNHQDALLLTSDSASNYPPESETVTEQIAGQTSAALPGVLLGLISTAVLYVIWKQSKPLTTKFA